MPIAKSAGIGIIKVAKNNIEDKKFIKIKLIFQ